MTSADSRVTMFSMPDTPTRSQCPVISTVLLIPDISTAPPVQVTVRCSAMPLREMEPPPATESPYADGGPALPTSLGAALQARMGTVTGGTPPPLVLVADRELPYQSLRAVMKTAAAAGLTEVSFAVRRKEAS